MRRSKYGAVRTTVDQITFASKKEAKRYGELKLLAKAGEILNLILQPKYIISIHGNHICAYIADFQYEECGQLVVEDCKGMKTDVYKLKRRLMKAVLGIDIKEV